MMRVVASREAMHSALSNAIACGDDGEVIELLGTDAEFPPDPRFAYYCSVTDHTFSFTSANVWNDPDQLTLYY